MRTAAIRRLVEGAPPVAGPRIAVVARRTRRSAPRVHRPEAVLRLRPRRAARCLRGRVRGDAARPDRAGRRRPGRRAIRTILLGGAAGVFVGPDALDMPLTFEATRAVGRDARVGRDHGLRRDRRPRRHPPPDRPVLPRRVVRPVRAVPGRHACARRSCWPGLPPARASGRATRSWRCCARSARRCATRRSAGSARRPRRRSSPRCGSRVWWRCDATG